MTDIIFSILCHISPECFVDTLENLIFFNKANRIKIIVNSNNFMYKSLADKYKDNSTIMFYPNPWDKVGSSFCILEGHIQNFEYCKNNNISSTYFIMLASNCMFHRQLTLSEIEIGLMTSENVTDISQKNIIHQDWHWTAFYQNKKIMNILNNNNIFNLKHGQCEGFIFEYDMYDKMVDFIQKNKIKDLITSTTVFEEILPHTLYTYFTKKKPFTICRMFWELPKYTPSIEHILNTQEPCVKRVLLDMNNPVRVWIRSNQN